MIKVRLYNGDEQEMPGTLAELAACRRPPTLVGDHGRTGTEPREFRIESHPDWWRTCTRDGRGVYYLNGSDGGGSWCTNIPGPLLLGGRLVAPDDIRIVDWRGAQVITA